MKTINIQTTGMHCSSCEMLVSEALEDLPGVSKAAADHKTGKISVTFDEQQSSVEAIKDCIKEQGYEA
ncbi:heavy metal transporter [Candidatus Woesearchaeota archaeon CG1_02_57_44]|nr:MAG: heavy metal transporter [Candidatus Woesearchaeota archaeon CG1_02_57_44]PIN68461.1 MAG: heavy metal transporter [Candidatus Woesearchaeota archaeon CG11_big_fil_rev_8_21_14_0_20_57_5]